MQNQVAPSRRLSSLVEGDESPMGEQQSSVDAIVSSPRTPATVGRLQPSREEMHPALAHQSTARKPDSGLRFGFTDVTKDISARQHSGYGPLSTPSKVAVTSPSFDFRFARPAPDLGPEAQRMMDELRHEALRIKEKLAAEREDEKHHRSNDDQQAPGVRKIAQPKGKVGRFSDVHMEAFKKMDSIAGHPSAFRAQPDRVTPPKRSLKRSQSKAKLDDRDDEHGGVQTVALPQHHLKNTLPRKRARMETSEDLASTEKPSQVPSAAPSTPNTQRCRTGFLKQLTTPTQSSLARASAVKTTQIPALSKSPSKPNLATPGRLAKSATTSRLQSVTNSILRRAEKSSILTVKTPSKLDLNKELPFVPGSARLVRSQSVKHVNFEESGKITASLNQSPSPVKTGLTRSNVNKDLAAVKYPLLPLIGEPSEDIGYPSLSPSRPLPKPPQFKRGDTPQPSKAVPSTFTFRSDQTASFGTTPHGFGSSPGQASLRQVRPSITPDMIPGSFPVNDKEHAKPLPTISHGIPNKKRRRAGSDQETEEELDNDKENEQPLPAIPHGMSNKKRHRAGSEDETEEPPERSPKKHKGHQAAEGATLVASQLQARMQAEKRAPRSKIPSPSKKGSLSISRLNMLARPKNRRLNEPQQYV
ncbi:MAG: hypothetical protein M1818_004619 [Claussenomyces sp. TS43310]|nr:MAG: hypothetical protein M1818_004619 [Claussenomyces sp. TS43310]